ncbi:phosphoribosyltransferase family protein [Leuconostoc fallax]|uniref:Phosphoribosyltransferase domain-containing protein n=1 Tax=Leuconostoc fallax TaxID=1251 RepID=A0A4R5N757_9LACO|nr:phosphoribosyltransferase family protein [Leuconostoc fallax]MBU7455266.1 adenine phosphoribosyltransferase [Leuconostoc fallax]TDG67627.1 hypothetical protein C5L23_001426 [Leuconostoc fallax]
MISKNYTLAIGHVKRDLPIVPINSTTSIASFVLLGDAELAHEAAQQLKNRLPKDFDCIVTMESKGIPLAQELAVLMQQPRYVVLRKSVKSYMNSPLTTDVSAITTQAHQQLVLDQNDADYLQNKNIILLDDVISSGGSLLAAETLLQQINVKIITKAAILAEGDAAKRDDIVYLQPLPLFKPDA